MPGHMKAGVGPPGRLWHQTRVERFPSAAPQADQVFVVIDRQRVPDAAVAQVGGLDDPFAHTDPDRMRLGIELLAEIAGKRQVVLISEDPRVVELAQIAAPDLTVIELSPPS